MPPSVLATTLSLVGLQIASRLFSFGLNQALLRSTTPQAFGLATIQLDTLIGTVLFLLREGIRGAIVRTPSQCKSPAEANLRRQTLLIPTLLSPVAIAAFVLYYLYNAPTQPPPQYTAVVALYLVAAVLELLSEPLYLRTLQSWETLTTRRVRVEGVAVLAKAVATLVTIHYVSEADALLAFGVGQLLYSATIWAGLAWVMSTERTNSGQQPRTVGRLGQVEGRIFDPVITKLAWALTKQSVVKQLLTEGDKLAVGRFGSAADMGGYAVALNYGSLLARIVFQPLEESSRLYFSTLPAQGGSPELGSRSFNSSEDRVVSQEPHKPTSYSTFDIAPPPTTVSDVASYLRLLLLLYTHLTLIFVCLAPAFTTPLLHLLLGSRWSRTSAAPLLRSYALSLPCLAFNGLTEAFFQSVAPPRWIARGSAWLVACAAAFAGTVWYLMRVRGWGAEGLIAANCVNLVMRTALSSVFIYKYFAETRIACAKATPATTTAKPDEGSPLRPAGWLPRWLTIAAFCAGGWAARISESRWEELVLSKGAGLRATAEHLAFGVIIGVGCLAVIALEHRNEIRQVLVSRRSQAAKKAQ